MPVGEQCREYIEAEAHKAFTCLCLLRREPGWIGAAGAMEMSSDGGGENDECQTAQEEFTRINHHRKRIEILTQYVTGGEWEERQAEEQKEIRIQDRSIDMLQPVHQMIVIDPVDPGVSKREKIHSQRRGNGTDECLGAGFPWHFELQHHNGD